MFEPKADRPHRAGPEQGSAGAGHPARQGDGGRLRPRSTPPRAVNRRRRISASRLRPRPCGASSASASSVLRCSSWSERWRGSAGDERYRHRGAGSHQALRRGHGGRRRLVHDRPWRDLRPARPQRRRQDHDHPDDARPDRSDGRHGSRDGIRPGARAAAGQAAGRLSAGHRRLLRSHDGGGQSPLHRRPDRHTGRPSATPGSPAALDRVGLGDVPTSTSATSPAACGSGSGLPRS